MMDYTQQKDALRTLILRHEQIITNIESRLDSLGSVDDQQTVLVRSQLEFLLLNVETAKMGHEQSLRTMESMDSMAPRNFSPAYGNGTFPSNLRDLIPAGRIKTEDIDVSLFFQRAETPNVGLVLYRMKDGTLMSPLGDPFPQEKLDSEGWELKSSSRGL